MIIRKEITSDSEAIDSVTAAAFMTLAISRHTEPFIIRALRAAGALTLSLVAEDEGASSGISPFRPSRFPMGQPAGTESAPFPFCPRIRDRALERRSSTAGYP